MVPWVNPSISSFPPKFHNEMNQSPMYFSRNTLALYAGIARRSSKVIKDKEEKRVGHQFRRRKVGEGLKKRDALTAFEMKRDVSTV